MYFVKVYEDLIRGVNGPQISCDIWQVSDTPHVQLVRIDDDKEASNMHGRYLFFSRAHAVNIYASQTTKKSEINSSSERDRNCKPSNEATRVSFDI